MINPVNGAEVLTPDQQYLTAINEFYGDRTATRSKIPLIHHIKEGVEILRGLEGSTDNEINAFCVHPMFQDDEYLLERDLPSDYISLHIATEVMKLVMEYRHVANQYLPKHHRLISERYLPEHHRD